MNCPTCTAPVEEYGAKLRRYIYVQPEPIDLDALRARAADDALRDVEARLRSKPQLGWQRVVREKREELRPALVEAQRG